MKLARLVRADCIGRRGVGALALHMNLSTEVMRLTEARILVTGGAGFIGSALVHELNRRGADRIVIADHLGTGEKWRNLAPLSFEDYVEKDDLIGLLARGALGSFDLVLHLGACSSTTETDASFLVRNNYEYTKSLATWATAAEARFVYASSAATYGSGEQGMSDADDSADALLELRPLNMYGYSKQLFDLWASRHGLLSRITGLKYFNIFGPNEAHKGDMMSLVAKAVPQVLESGRLRLFRSHRPDFDDGEQRRDFLYVGDAADMTLYLAERPHCVGIFNVGSGRASTWNELAHALFHALGRETEIEYIDMPESIRAKYQYHTQADLTRLRESGYDRAPRPLGDAVREYVRDYILPDRRLGDPLPSSRSSQDEVSGGDSQIEDRETSGAYR